MERIDITLPKGWHELNDPQLHYFFRLKAGDFLPDAIKSACLCSWGGIYIKRHGWDRESSRARLRDGREFLITPMQVAELTSMLDWLDTPPDYPVRFSDLKGRKALDITMRGVAFETFLCAENYYQGYLVTTDGSLINQLAELLYPAVSPKAKPIDGETRLCAFYWMLSLKKFFRKKFHYFYKEATPETDNLLGAPKPPSQEEITNIQIRALTKGDVTKEKEILALDTWRALTELNELAREAQEQEKELRKYGK